VNANLPIAQAATAEAGMAKTGVVKAAAVKAAVAALLLASTLYLSAGPHQADNSSASVAHSMATRQKVIGISNFSKVSPSLYRGGQPASAGIESLQKMGIGIVVDMRGGRNQSEKAAVQKAGMQAICFDSVALSFSQRQNVCQVFKVDSGKPAREDFRTSPSR
jgi:hypothetical protein